MKYLKLLKFLKQLLIKMQKETHLKTGKTVSLSNKIVILIKIPFFKFSTIGIDILSFHVWKTSNQQGLSYTIHNMGNIPPTLLYLNRVFVTCLVESTNRYPYPGNSHVHKLSFKLIISSWQPWSQCHQCSSTYGPWSGHTHEFSLSTPWWHSCWDMSPETRVILYIFHKHEQWQEKMTKLQCYQHGITIIIVQLYRVYQFYIISWTVAVLYNLRYKISFDLLKDTCRWK